MPRKNPIGKLTSRAFTAAGHVGRTAMKTASAAASRRKQAERGPAQATRVDTPSAPLRAVPSEPTPSAEPSPHGDPLEAAAKKAAKKAPAQKATPADVAKKAAKKAPAQKTTANKATAKKATAKKATAKKATAKKAAAKKSTPGDKLPPKRNAESAGS